MLIGLHGYPGVGKDAVAKVLVDTYGWHRVAFADKMRSGLLALNPIVVTDGGRGMRLRPLVVAHGWDKLKRSVPEVRELLQRFGTEAGRDLHGEDVWVNLALRELQTHICDYVITDVRFQNEADAIRTCGGVVVNVLRPGFGPVNDHVSERPLACDYDLHNDDLNALGSRVAHLLWWIENRAA